MIRVIGGEFSGRNLRTPEGRDVRPSSGLLRKVMFDLIGPRVMNTTVLDLYAGPGSLGIEALSRGAAECTFVERQPLCLRLLRENLQTFGLEDRSHIVAADTAEFCRNDYGRYDGILVDPPYADWAQLQSLGLQRLLASQGFLVVQGPSHAPDDPLGLGSMRRRAKTHGKSKIVIYE